MAISTIGARVSCCRNYTDAIIDRLNIDNGNFYHTEEECKEAYESQLAEVRLRMKRRQRLSQ